MKNNAEQRADRSIVNHGLAGKRDNPFKRACIAAAEFNAKHPIGSRIHYGDADWIVTSQAWVEGNEAMVFLNGIKSHVPTEAS